MDPHRDNYLASEEHLLSGMLLNQKAAALNLKMGYTVDGSKLLQRCPDIDIMAAKSIVTVMKVTEDSDACPIDELGHKSAPCDSEFLYLGTVKYFDASERRWVEYGEDLPLDSSLIEKHFKKNDVVPVFWDRLRGSFVPLSSATFSDPDAIRPRYHAMLQTVTGVEVLQADNQHRDERDSLVEVYCQVIREGLDGESEWQTIGRLSWMVPWLDTQRAWEDSRSGFATFQAPKGSKLRFITGGSWHPHPDDIHDVFEVIELEWMTFGLSRWDPSSPLLAHDHEVGLIPEFDGDGVPQILIPGRQIGPYLQITEVQSGEADSPHWSHNGDGIITQSYEDDAGHWLTAIAFQATMRSSRTVAERFEDGDIGVWYTRLSCTQDLKIDSKCTRTFGFSGGIGNRIDLGSSGNPEECNSCQNDCGLCTWEWTQDPTSDGFGNPLGDDFWNNTDPCAETGPADCTCDEPSFDGSFYGEIVFTICTEPSSSSRSSTTSSSMTSQSSTSTKSSASSSSSSST